MPTGADVTETPQAGDLTQLVDAAQAYSGTFNVTDYRWFNLRDSNSSAAGSLPGAATTFATDGLLRDDYSAKPAFTPRIVLRLRGGKIVSYRRRVTLARCRLVAAHRGRRAVAATSGDRLQVHAAPPRRESVSR